MTKNPIMVRGRAVGGRAGGRAGRRRRQRRASAKARAAPLLLTPAQLRECIAQKERLHSGNEQSVREQAELAQNKAEIDRLGVALKEQLAGLDRTSADAVAAYNARVESRDKLIDAYQEACRRSTPASRPAKTERAAYAKSCENKRYDEADEISIRKGR